MTRTAAMIFSLCVAVVAYGDPVEVVQLPTAELQARYLILIEEMRCPKCQNQNLSGSDSPVAADLRREIRRLLEEGFTDSQINEYMVARYGDFILYRPPLQRNTLALWAAPGVFAALGLLALVLIVLRSRSGRGTQQDVEAVELTEAERKQLQQLLRDSGHAGSKKND